MKKNCSPNKRDGIGLKFISYLIHPALAFIFILITALSTKTTAQQFVKTYTAYGICSQTSANLMFNCITRSAKVSSTFYIAGIQDSSIYVAEVDAMGVVLQEKSFAVKSVNYVLRSMITDDDGNIVIVGSSSANYPYESFLMKMSPALSLLLHRTYSNGTATPAGSSAVFFNDIKDNKQSGYYYICGSVRSFNNTTAADALLLRVDRNTGLIGTIKIGHAGEDGYDALVFRKPSANSTLPYPGLIATGRLSGAGTATFRPWIISHRSDFSFDAGKRYIQDITPNTPGRLYSSSLINDGNSLAYCWEGDISNTLDLGINTGLSVFDSSSLTPIWQREYVFSPQPQLRKLLNKVAADPLGYVAEGNWWDGTSQILTSLVGEMFLLRTDKNGTAIWSRKLNNIFVGHDTHNAAFVIDGGSIFSVGWKRVAGSTGTVGALVRIPLLNGAMDTACASIQTVNTVPYQFSAPDQATFIDTSLLNNINYYAVNCNRTDTVTICNQPCTSTTQLNSGFDLTGQIIGANITNYIVTASSFSTAPNSRWIVSEANILFPYNDIPGTIYSSLPSGIWGTTVGTQFGGYFGAETLGTSTGFLQGRKYRFKHILSTTNSCGLSVSDTTIKSIFMCSNCRQANGTYLVVETEKSSNGPSRSEMFFPASNDMSMRLMPNPANDGFVSVEYQAEPGSSTQLVISDVRGRQIITKQLGAFQSQQNKVMLDIKTFASGTYTVTLTNNGKSMVQKLVIAK